jgi:hypothetical protein
MAAQSIKRQFSLYPATLTELVIACTAGVLLGLGCILFSPQLVVALIGVSFLALVVVKRPEFGLLGILLATSTIISADDIPLLPIGIGSLTIVDIGLLGILGLILLHRLVEPNFRLFRTPLDLPLLLFYGLSLVSTIAAGLQPLPTTEFKLAMKDVRLITYYLTFFIVTTLVRSQRQQRFLLQGMLLLSTAVAMAMVVQYAMGASVILLPGRVESLSVLDASYHEVTRILPPGEALVLVGFIVTLVILVLTPMRPAQLLTVLQCCLLGIGVVLTFNRNFWVMILLAGVLLSILAGKALLKRLLWVLPYVFVALVILQFTPSDSKGSVQQLLRASIERASTLTSTDVLSADSLVFREVENKYALAHLSQIPLLGLGLGARYRPFTTLDWEAYDGRGYIHNGHFWIMLKSGILAYLCLMWLSALFLLRGFRHWRSVSDPVLRSGVLAFTLTYVGILIACIVNPMFMQWSWAPLVGMMLGFNEAVFRSQGLLGDAKHE